MNPNEPLIKKKENKLEGEEGTLHNETHTLTMLSNIVILTQ